MTSEPSDTGAPTAVPPASAPSAAVRIRLRVGLATLLLLSTVASGAASARMPSPAPVVRAVPSAGAPIGLPPALDVAGRDLATRLALPALPDRPGSDAARQAAALQVGIRAKRLGLDGSSATEAWRAGGATLADARERLAHPPPQLRRFNGSRASALNRLLAEPGVTGVRVGSATLQVDETIRLRRAGVWLDLGRSRLAASTPGLRFLIRIDAPRVTVSGGRFVGGAWGVLVDSTTRATLRSGEYDGLARGGIVAHDARGTLIADNQLSRIDGAPILLHGATFGSAVIDNRIVGNRGVSNWHAGLVLSDRNAEIARDPDSLLQPDRHGVLEQRIDSRLRTPHDNLIAFNRIALNLASGIYVDGAVRNVFFDNLIEGNSKEGACLDNGSSANVVAMNLIRQNGQRWGMSDAALRLDFVAAMGRLADGSSPAKTPGLSLDNAIYNVIYANQIDRNQGGGVKMVRSAFFNTVALNLVTDNNEGANPRFHFFGIELGAAPADTAVADLDFAPSRGNVLVGNVIRGSHYAGIFYGNGSTDNEAFDNSVFGATHWAMEQVRRQANRSLNNLSNQPSRNIGNGIDPALIDLGRGRFD